MAGAGTSQYCLEVYVHTVTRLTLPTPRHPVIVLRLLDFPSLVVERRAGASALSESTPTPIADPANGFAVGAGKSCVFAAPTSTLTGAGSTRSLNTVVVGPYN